jgi:glycosyltransferase involved in cell wall biosynthesis
MMNLFINGLAASAGGGLTYLRNVVPHLASRRDVRTTLAVSPVLRRELGNPSNVTLVELRSPSGAMRRFWQEQTLLPSLIRRSAAEVLISAGNVALHKSPVPQILLSRNALYTSSDFSRDLRARREYNLLLDTRIKGALARWSIHWADCTVAPSQTFARELNHWAAREIASIHHGFDRDAFFSDGSPLPVDIQHKLNAAEDSLRLLFVSHYNYYRNFETLLRAIPLLQTRMGKRKVRLFLTCKLRSGGNPGSYRAESAAALVRCLNITDQVVELGSIPYPLLHHVYRACDIYVTPAYAESFAHPLVEAMASGLPIVASDLAVHREICGLGAVYFPRFSPELLADCVLQICQSSQLRHRLADSGLKRSADFSWAGHVEQVIGLAMELGKRPYHQVGRSGMKRSA